MHTHGLAIEICLSDRLSVKCVHCDKTKETSAHIFIPYERSIIVVFRQEKTVIGERLLNFWQCHWNAFLLLYSSLADSDVHGRNDNGEICTKCESSLSRTLSVSGCRRRSGEQLQLWDIRGTRPRHHCCSVRRRRMQHDQTGRSAAVKL